ncbi:MAG: gamma-glutamyltransferase [Pseudomonadota bacterium]
MRFPTLAAALALLAACGAANAPDPEAPAEETSVEAWTKGAMVAAADPRAVEAGLEVLRQGGHAVDAAIAVHAVLGLVEPQSSGLGGGAFMLVFERETGEITVYDGRETAPAASGPDLFLDDSGEPLGFLAAWQSGLSIGVPGQVALYKTAHDAHGEAAWDGLFQRAIDLAETGFVVSPRLAGLLASPRLQGAVDLDDNPATAAYFYPDGEPLAEGAVRDNPDYAETLRRIADEGPSAFYSGEIAEAIVAAAAGEPRAGSLSMTDLAEYRVIVREPLCGAFRTYRICSAPPPSSGGVAQNAILGLYDRLAPDAETAEIDLLLQAFVDAQRLGYADRDHYVADADHVTVPAAELIDPRYLDVRATERFAPDARSFAGDPGAVLRGEPMVDMWGRDVTETAPGTTHISIVDQNGNAVSMTATVEAPFGASRWAAGFLLNNELTDFARSPTKNGKPLANAPAPGKRPRSSMSPTLVFDEAGDLFMVTGSPGGNSIIAYVAKTLVAVLDWGHSAQEAADLPNVIARGDRVGVEVDVDGGPQAAEALRDLGYDVQEREGENSGLHVIVVREDGLEGGADTRREGVARALN